MDELDDTDREILDILLSDSRRPYSAIADAVGLSPPAVSDRIEQLQEMGVIRRFTVDIDRSVLARGVPVLVTVTGVSGAGPDIEASLAAADETEHVFRTVDDTVVATMTVRANSAGETVRDRLDLDAVREYEIRLLDGRDWQPQVGDATFAPECVECGNTVTEEGERERIDGEVYHFCCASCKSAFVDQYERLSDGA
jgi:DNA-binding Lrp family transcriptional regulator